MTSRERFLYPIESRFSETDAMGLIHHSVYLVWFEAARFKFAQEVMRVGPDLLDETGVQLPVYSCSCRFIKPVQFPDKVQISVRVQLAKAAKLAVLHEAMLDRGGGDVTVASCRTEHVFIRAGGTLVPRVPPIIVDRLLAAVNKHPHLFLGVDEFRSAL